MKRIAIKVDMENNPELEKAIDDLIKDSIVGRVRALVEETMQEELDRIIAARIADWTKAKSTSYWGQNDSSGLRKIIESKIDAAIKESISSISVTSKQIDERIAEHIANAAAGIDQYVSNKIDKLPIWSTMDTVVSAQVRAKTKEIMSDRMMEIMFSALMQEKSEKGANNNG